MRALEWHDSKESEQSDNQESKPSQPKCPDSQLVEKHAAYNRMPIRSEHIPAPTPTAQNRQQSENHHEKENASFDIHNVCGFDAVDERPVLSVAAEFGS
jgi:hypothetical protein